MKRRILKTVFSVSGVIVVAKILGFVRQMVTASLFGATMETDLINLSQGLLGDVDNILIHVLLTSFTALYLRLMDADPGEVRRAISDMLKAFALIAVGAIALAFIAAPLVARILAHSYEAEDLAKLTGYMRLYLPLVPLFVFSSAFTSMLNAHKRFLPAHIVGINISLFSLLLLPLLSRTMGAKSLILTFFAYTIWNFLYLGFLSRRYWRLERGGNPFANPHVRELLRMSAPLLLGYSMTFINSQVDKSLTSGLGEGAVTALGYGGILSALVSTFIMSFCSILFTYTVSAISRDEHQNAAALTARATGLLLLAFLPVSLLTVLCAGDIVRAAFGHGAFSAQAVDAAASALRGYGLMFVPLVVREVCTRFQYGYKDTRRPTIASSIGIACNIVLSILFSRWWGIFGIACATSVSVLVCGLLNLFYSRKLNPFLDFKFPPQALLLILLASGACLASATWINGLLADAAPYFRFPAAAACGLTSYFIPVAPFFLKLLRNKPKPTSMTPDS